MENYCQKCGRRLRPGELRYYLKLELTSMFDGVVEEPEEDLDAELERLIEAVSRQDPEEVAKDVAFRLSLVVCRSCRNRLVEEYDRTHPPRLVH